MTSDENPSDPQGAPGPQEPQEPQEPQSAPDGLGVPDAQDARGAYDAQDPQDPHDDSAEQSPQTWSSPPNGGGEYRDSGRLTRPAQPQEWQTPETSGTSGASAASETPGDPGASAASTASVPSRSGQPRLPGSAWLVTLIGATVYAVSLTLVLSLTMPIVLMAQMSGSVGLGVAAPVVALALAAFLFWAFRSMVRAARFPRPTAAMVLFTAVVVAGFVGSIAVPAALGFGEADERILGAGVVAAVLGALALLLSRGERIRWGAALAAVVLVVSGVASWQRGDGMVDSMAEEQREILLRHEDDVAILDVGAEGSANGADGTDGADGEGGAGDGVAGWEPYRSEINEAMHETVPEAGSGSETGSETGTETGTETGAEGDANGEGNDGTGGNGEADAGADPGAGAGAGAGREVDPSAQDWLNVFTVFYQDGGGGYLRTATWADDRTAEDPDAVLRAWCGEEGTFCAELEVEVDDAGAMEGVAAVDAVDAADAGHAGSAEDAVDAVDAGSAEDGEGAGGAEGSGDAEGSEDEDADGDTTSSPNPNRPVIAQWDIGESEELSELSDVEELDQLGAPQSLRYEYEPGRVVYLGPWTDEPDRSQDAGPEGADGADGTNGAEGSEGTARTDGTDGTQASPGGETTLGHADFDVQELTELVTHVRPADDEDLIDLADRTAEYFRSPESVLTEFDPE